LTFTQPGRRCPVTLEQLRDLSIVILGVETFFLCAILAAVLYFAISGTSKAILKVRILGPRARGYFRSMADNAERTSQKITAPFVSVSSTRVRVERTVSAVYSAFSNRKEV
jgi:uncharacterized membrane protein